MELKSIKKQEEFMNREVVFVDGMRTAFGTLGRTLSGIMGEELAGACIKGLVQRSGIVERGGAVDCCFMGSAIGPLTAINGARWPVLAAGLPDTT